jgi:transcriptional regulator with XRE-family HTH domain
MKPTLGQMIRQARIAKGLSQAQLAHAIGVSQAAIGQWERGEFTPKGKHVNALAGVLDAAFPYQPDETSDEYFPFRRRIIGGNIRADSDSPEQSSVSPSGGRIQIAEHKAHSSEFESSFAHLLIGIDPTMRTHIAIEGPLSKRWVIDYLTQKSVIEVKHPLSYRRIDEIVTFALWRLVVIRSLIGQDQNYIAIVRRPPAPTGPMAFAPPNLDGPGLLDWYEQKLSRLRIEADLVGVELVVVDTAEEAAKWVEESEHRDAEDERTEY